MEKAKLRQKRGKMNKKEARKVAGIFTITLIAFILSMSFLLAENSVNQEDLEKYSDEEVVVDFFWSSGCPHCADFEDFLEEMEEDYDFKINSYDISRNSELFSEKAEEYDIPNNRRGYTPTIFIDDQYFIGNSDEAKQYIKSRLKGEKTDSSENVNETVSSEILGLWEIDVSLNEKSILGAGVVLALLDSINVCSITLLVFLIIFTLSIGSLKRAFKTGLIFTSIIFIFYVLFMLVLTEILGSLVMDYGSYIRAGVVFLCFIAGGLLIKDMFWYGKGVSLKVPDSAKPMLEKYIKRATVGSTITLGILASLVELPCTAVFPLVYTTILAEAGIEGFQKILYVLIYNLIYVWPLLFVVFATKYSSTKIENIDKFVQKNKKYMRLIAGVALLAIALYFGLPLIN